LDRVSTASGSDLVKPLNLTPKAFANFSPGFELARTLGSPINFVLTLKGFANRLTLSGFSFCIVVYTQGCRWRSNLGLKLANASGVIETAGHN